MQETHHRSPTRRRKRLTERRPSIRKRNRTATISGYGPISGVCDNDRVGIRTRRMSAAAAADDDCDNQKSANLVAADNVNVENRSRLTSTSTAAGSSTEVDGRLFSILLQSMIVYL